MPIWQTSPRVQYFGSYGSETSTSTKIKTPNIRDEIPQKNLKADDSGQCKKWNHTGRVEWLIRYQSRATGRDERVRRCKANGEERLSRTDENRILTKFRGYRSGTSPISSVQQIRQRRRLHSL